MSGDEIFGYGWREDHARAGDVALEQAEHVADWPKAAALAAIAQAHYAAANIRTRPIRNVELP